MAKKKNISIQDIARLCGVSTATVSRVLNNEPNVSEETRKKILHTIKTNHYVLNKTPRSAKHVPKVGIIIPSSDSDYYNCLLRQVGQLMWGAGYAAVACCFELQSDLLPGILDALYDSNVSGIILIGCGYKSIEKNLSLIIPHVWIDCDDPPETIPHICTVQSDQYFSGQLAAQELIGKGCTRPLMLTGTELTHRGLDRINGFMNTFTRSQLPFEESQIVYLPNINNMFVESRDIVKYYIAKEFSFDSIFAINDWRSLGALVGVQSTKLRVPDDIRIVGFDGISITCSSILNITSVQQNTELLSRNAADLLFHQINKKEIRQTHVLVPTNLIAGQTT